MTEKIKKRFRKKVGLGHHARHLLKKEVNKTIKYTDSITWGLVKDGFTAKRNITNDVLKRLQLEGFQGILITGAGGEGTSTILMQLAVELNKTGSSVYYASEPGGETFKLIHAPQKNRRPHHSLKRCWT